MPFPGGPNDANMNSQQTTTTRPQGSRRGTPSWLLALGRNDLPPEILCDGAEYKRARVLKHDFFAATGLYEGTEGAVILKIGRTADLFGFPMEWLGAFLCRREVVGYQRLSDVPGVPALIGRVGRTGFVHAFVPGHDLRAGERVSDEFFSLLRGILDAVHAKGMAYVDLEKRENILVDNRGDPCLIDFQISWYWPLRRGGRSRAARWLLHRCQESDHYHLLKHWRRHRPDQLTDEQVWHSRQKPTSIRFHQWVARPLTRLRRRMLKKLDPARAIGR